jgi:hypothetical protein
MSTEGREPSADALDSIRLSVSPEPTDEELLAIVQALQLLDDSADDHERAPKRSAWEETALDEVLRSRTWRYQARSWTARSRSF